MKICFVGLDNLPVLASAYEDHQIGGESVQQTLLARALARRGWEVSMVVRDHGQQDGAAWHGVRTFKAYRAGAGLPVMRFFHPRLTGLWSALTRADAAIYYTSCAGMEAGIVALFCRRHGRRFVFRTASDSDCDPSRLLIEYARDRWLYALGLRRADAILVQSTAQRVSLALHYGLPSRVAAMLVEHAAPAAARDIDVLWVSNIRREKRPDRLLDLAAALPHRNVHVVGGPLPGEAALYRDFTQRVAMHANVQFHGRLSYAKAAARYSRARLLVNTSDVEGFPNSYLQAWARGVPVVTLIDPDGTIEREGLGIAVPSAAMMPGAINRLLSDAAGWQSCSERCTAFMAREHGEDQALAVYIETFNRLVGAGTGRASLVGAR